jgi:hypothetical protein
MKGLLIGLLTLTACAEQPALIGVAASGPGTPCVAFEGTTKAVESGTAVTLVFPEQPQRIETARVGEARSDCDVLARGDVAGSYHTLLTDRPLGQGGWVAIAVTGEVRLENGHATAELDGAAPRETFRACTSTEGLHLTAWSGGKRVWHAYFLLGYDVEPSCSDAEMSSEMSSRP